MWKKYSYSSVLFSSCIHDLTWMPVDPVDQLLQSNHQPYNYFSLLKLKILALTVFCYPWMQGPICSQNCSALISKCRLKKQAAGLNNKSRHQRDWLSWSWIRKRNKMLGFLYSHMYLNEAFTINQEHILVCFSRRNTGRVKEDQRGRLWLLMVGV